MFHVELSFKIPFHCPDNIAPFLQKVFSGEYDLPGVHFPVGARVIDLGANFGSFAIWAAHRWPGCEILSFEPHPGVFEGLKHNIQAYSQITAHPWGIGDEGVRVLHDGANNDGERSFHGVVNHPNPTGQHCEVRSPLTLPDCDLLKMDIEGCEVEVLTPLIEKGYRPKVIMLEYHNHKIRRTVDSLLADYELVGGETTSMLGLGVGKYLRKDVLKEIFGAFVL